MIWNKYRKYFNFILGVLISAIAFNLFFLSNNLAAYGISGLSIVLKHVWSFDPSTFILVGNLILITISYFALGVDYTKKTIIGAILYPLFIRATAFLPDMIDLSQTNLLAVALFGGAIAGFGGALIYKEGFGTAGTDITNQIIHKYIKLPMGTAIAIGDGLVVLIGGIVFGLEPMIFSLITLLTMSIICDKFMIGISKTKNCFIITTKEKEIKDFLINSMKNDITIMEGMGGYNHKKQTVLMTVVDTKKYGILKESIKRIDPKAFISVTDSYESFNKNKQIKKSTN